MKRQSAYNKTRPMDEPEPETLWLLPPGLLSSYGCLEIPMGPGPGGDPDLHLVVVVTTPGGPRDADEQVIG